LNSQRKNALTSLPMVTVSSPVAASRKPWETEYRPCIGWSGSKFMTIVSAPMERLRAKTS